MPDLTPEQVLRTAVTYLRCDHRFPVQPPHGSLANPGDCDHCGKPYRAGASVGGPLRDPLADLLEDTAEAWPDGLVDPIGRDRKYALRAARAITGRES